MWSRTLPDANTNDTAAANRAPSPRATDAVWKPRNTHGPAVRRATDSRGNCASVNTEISRPS